MQLIDRIEKRRFIGREFLLYLWFESEVLDATLSVPPAHAGGAAATVGFWIERSLVLSAGKEGTRIRGNLPAKSREAKESLLLGKLPESAGLHISWGDREISLTLKAERMALSGVALPVVLDKVDPEPELLRARPPGRSKKRRSTPEQDGEREEDDRAEAFYERMHLTREVEELMEALYRDFLRVRLSAAWKEVVRPAIAAWATGKDGFDADRYQAAKRRALTGGSKAGKANPTSRKGRAAPASLDPR